MSTDHDSTGMRNSHSLLRGHCDAWFSTVSSPDEEFMMADVPEFARGTFRRVLRTDAVEKADRMPRREAHDYVEVDGNVVHTYQWSERAWGMIESAKANQFSPCPCDHGGVTNNGDHYQCSYPACDDRYSRDELFLEDDR